MTGTRRPKTYRLGTGQRWANSLFTAMTTLGLGASYRHLLTVRGRTSGLPRTNPVDVMTGDGSWWLVAPYGEVNWVKNLRAARTGELRRGRRVRRFRAEEVGPAEAVPVIRRYIERVPITRAYWGVDADADDEALLAEAARHPVFRVTLYGPE